jgi:DNA-(apurinic or apyrimidinic site) lyase
VACHIDIGVLTVPLGGQSLDETCEYLTSLGVDAVELILTDTDT